MMFVEKGFVALYRKFKDWEWYQDSNTVRVFLHLLLSANWKPTRFAGSCIERGSCVLTRKRIAKDLNLTEQEVRTALNHLISTNEITCQSTNKFSILNIVKFNDYQVSENENQPTINQQINQQINPIRIIYVIILIIIYTPPYPPKGEQRLKNPNKILYYSGRHIRKKLVNRRL